MTTSSNTKKLSIPIFHLVQPINSDILEAIGAVTIAWGGIETLVDQAIARILRLSHKEQAAITTGITFKFRLDMLEDSVKAQRMGKVRRTEIESIIVGIKDVQIDRNFLAHALWMRGGSIMGGIVGYVGRRNAVGYRKERWDTQYILALAHKISDLETRLFYWVHMSARSLTRFLASQRKS